MASLALSKLRIENLRLVDIWPIYHPVYLRKVVRVLSLAVPGFLLIFSQGVPSSVSISFGGIYLLAATLEALSQLLTIWRKRHGKAKPETLQIELHPAGPTLSTMINPKDLEAGAKKLKTQSSTRKPRYGPDKKEYQSNYTGLADLMAENPEKAIVRRFTQLNIKNLLYLQAELACLEADLNEAVEHDKKFTDTEEYALSWSLLEESDPTQVILPARMDGVEEHQSHYEHSPNSPPAPVPLVEEYSRQTKMSSDPSAAIHLPDMPHNAPTRKETWTSEEDMDLEPTDSWPGGISQVRSKQTQTLGPLEAQTVRLRSRRSEEPEQLSELERGHVEQSLHSKRSKEPSVERSGSHSRKANKKRGRHHDRDDHSRHIQPAPTPVQSDRPLHNDAPRLQRYLVHLIRVKLEKYTGVEFESLRTQLESIPKRVSRDKAASYFEYLKRAIRLSQGKNTNRMADKALEQVAFTFGLAKPEKLDIVDLQEWLRRDGFGNDFLVDAEKDIWSPKFDHDRVSLSLKPGEYDDTFSTTVSKQVVAILNRIYGLTGKKSKGQMFQWDDSWLFLAISLISTVLAACLPVLAILALYKLEGVQKGWQIGIIGFFSAFCAAALALAGARRTDVFLATSAFAAVMVVFIKA